MLSVYISPYKLVKFFAFNKSRVVCLPGHFACPVEHLICFVGHLICLVGHLYCLVGSLFFLVGLHHFAFFHHKIIGVRVCAWLELEVRELFDSKINFASNGILPGR